MFASLMEDIDSLVINPDISTRPDMLPNWVYTDWRVHQAEVERIFSGNLWIPLLETENIALGSDPVVDAPRPGDVTPFSFFGNRLLLTRDMEGKFHCFPNRCTHWQLRQLCDGPKNVARKKKCTISCPLHGRSFDLMGNCVSHHMLDIPPSEEDHIQKFKIEDWHGLLRFISLGEPDVSLQEMLAPLEEAGLRGLIQGAQRVRQESDIRVLPGHWLFHCLLFLDKHHVGDIHDPSLTQLLLSGTYHEQLYKNIVLQWAYAANSSLGINPELLPEEFHASGRRVFALWWFIAPCTCVLLLPWGIAIYSFFPYPADPTKSICYWIQYSTDDEKFARRHTDWHHEQVNREDTSQMLFMDAGGELGQRRCAPRFTKDEVCAHWLQRRYLKALQGR